MNKQSNTEIIYNWIAENKIVGETITILDIPENLCKESKHASAVLSWLEKKGMLLALGKKKNSNSRPVIVYSIIDFPAIKFNKASKEHSRSSANGRVMNVRKLQLIEELKQEMAAPAEVKGLKDPKENIQDILHDARALLEMVVELMQRIERATK